MVAFPLLEKNDDTTAAVMGFSEVKEAMAGDAVSPTGLMGFSRVKEVLVGDAVSPTRLTDFSAFTEMLATAGLSLSL